MYKSITKSAIIAVALAGVVVLPANAGKITTLECVTGNSLSILSIDMDKSIADVKFGDREYVGVPVKASLSTLIITAGSFLQWKIDRKTLRYDFIFDITGQCEIVKADTSSNKL